MMNTIFNGVTRVFDPLNACWEKQRTQRMVTGTLVFSFITALVVIELS